MDDYLFCSLFGISIAAVFVAIAHCMPERDDADDPARKACNRDPMRTHEYADVDGYRYGWINGVLQTEGLTSAQIKTAERNVPARVFWHRRKNMRA